MLRPITFILLGLFISLALPASAADEPSMDEEIKAALGKQIEMVKQLAMNELIVKATRTQNNENLTLATIKQRDEEWKATDELTEFKESLQKNTIGQFFKSKVEWSSSIYSEIFLTDNQGANVAAYPATADYWQGDEEQWTAAFNRGSGQVFIGPVELDESTGIRAVQISAPVLDAGKTIGVLILGVKLSYIAEQIGGETPLPDAVEP